MRLSCAIEGGDQAGVDTVMSELNRILNIRSEVSSEVSSELMEIRQDMDFVNVRPGLFGHREYIDYMVEHYLCIGYQVVEEFESYGGWFRMAAEALAATATHLMRDDMGLAEAYLRSLASSFTGAINMSQPHLSVYSGWAGTYEPCVNCGLA